VQSSPCRTLFELIARDLARMSRATFPASQAITWGYAVEGDGEVSRANTISSSARAPERNTPRKSATARL